ncbi:Spaetzle [Popillia japonica]|uniref:Spaetzle n=1 Tax=Popillia japonica TaxID=7064 RepID=A0AAW1N3A4_POPJA
MQIALLFRIFIAVFSLTAVLTPVFSEEHLNTTLLLSRSERSAFKFDEYEPYYSKDIPIRNAGKFLKPRENQSLLRQEIRNRTGVDCCPSVLEMVEPEGGKNQDDQYVELYRDGDNKQRFYELSCHQDVLGKPCRFMDRKLHNSSRCVQRYSYTYALVKDPGRRHHQRPKYFPSFPASGPSGETRWTLDYIKVRSGCSCVVTPIHKRPKKNKVRHV